MSEREIREREKLSHNTTKAEQKLKLLLADKVFQLSVKRLREKWGVNRDNQNREQNAAKLDGRLINWGSNPELQRRIEEKRRQSTRPLVLFHYDILDLLRIFKLDSEYWYQLIWDYVVTGGIDERTKRHYLSYLDAAPVLRPYTQPGTGKHKIIMEIGENTTLKDVKAIWRNVEEARKYLFPKRPKFKPWKNIERDAKLYALYLEGKSLATICNTIDKEYGGDMTETNARKIITIYRKRFGLDDKKKPLASRFNKMTTD